MSNDLSSSPHSTLTFYCKLIRGKNYGSCPCKIMIGEKIIDGYAVRCDEVKFASTKEDCALKFMEWGLSEVEAEMVITIGALFTEVNKLSLICDTMTGEYEEEIDKIVEDLAERMTTGEIKNKEQANSILGEHVKASSYVLDINLTPVVFINSGKNAKHVLELAGNIMWDTARSKLQENEEYKKLPWLAFKGGTKSLEG